jgi:3-hydroxyisobutyrate dehydrogenase-like beta-hydroxyacid dehydrogenase
MPWRNVFRSSRPLPDSTGRGSDWRGVFGGVQMYLVVNPLPGINMQAIAEVIALGEHLRFDRDVLLRVLSKTTVIAPEMAGKFQKFKELDDSPEFQLPLMSQDIVLVIDAARNAGADLPAASIAQSILASNASSRSDLNLFRSMTPFVISQGSRVEV